jgi:hypothetical protein
MTKKKTDAKVESERLADDQTRRIAENGEPCLWIQRQMDVLSEVK